MSDQIITVVELSELISFVKGRHEQGYRLVQIGCMWADERYQITYSFDKNKILDHLRLFIPEGVSVPSISSIYFAAFTYENEISDLFGVDIPGKVIDYKGTFIQTTIPRPFSGNVTKKTPEEKP